MTTQPGLFDVDAEPTLHRHIHGSELRVERSELWFVLTRSHRLPDEWVDRLMAAYDGQERSAAVIAYSLGSLRKQHGDRWFGEGEDHHWRLLAGAMAKQQVRQLDYGYCRDLIKAAAYSIKNRTLTGLQRFVNGT